MNSIIRVATVSNRIFIANPKKSANGIIELICGLKDISPDIILLPMHCLTGGECNDLLKNKSIIEKCEDAITDILDATKKLQSYIVIGSTLNKNAKPVPVTYLIYKGEVIGIFSENDSDYVFSIGDIKINICSIDINQLILSSKKLADIGTDITLIPSYTSCTALGYDENISSIKATSNAAACVIAVANGGIGDTSFPRISKGYAGIFECGEQCVLESSFENECISVYDVDADIVRANKASKNIPLYSDDLIYSIQQYPKGFLMRDLSETPYLPSNTTKRNAYLDDLFKLQYISLARRMQNINIQKLVIGVSGGLDSTLALLVCANAMDSLNLPRENIYTITMQGLGTSDKTHGNACTLMKSLGCNMSEIPIKNAVLQHLNDIGHDGINHDVTYENAQARERTQILFDIANMQNGIVVGTGDLSESALGFCTFGGDHLASFNVNVCLTKTVIRTLVTRLSETYFSEQSHVLSAIVGTPISPELLPVDDDGEISQKTETILGEYELHDFFLYYFVKYNFTPKKIFTYTCCAFPEKYEKEYIAEKLRIFLKRIITSQFKRSCTVDSAIITDISLNEFKIPSDVTDSELFSSQI